MNTTDDNNPTEPAPARLDFRRYETKHPATLEFAPWVEGASLEGITHNFKPEAGKHYVARKADGRMWIVDARELRDWRCEERDPRHAQIVGDLQPIQDIRAALLRLHAELRPLDPGTPFANRNDRVQRMQVDLNHVETLGELVDMCGAVVAVLRVKVDASKTTTEGFATPGIVPDSEPPPSMPVTEREG